MSNKTIKRWNLFWLFCQSQNACFVKVRKIGFPFSFYSTRPFDAKTEKNEADIFEVTDVERRPRSNFLDHLHYFQAVTFWVMALNRPFFYFFACPLPFDFFNNIFSTIFNVLLILFIIQAYCYLHLVVIFLKNSNMFTEILYLFLFFLVDILQQYFFVIFLGLWVIKSKWYIIHILHKCCILYILLIIYFIRTLH